MTSTLMTLLGLPVLFGSIGTKKKDGGSNLED
jgi:hypothetical protein